MWNTLLPLRESLVFKLLSLECKNNNLVVSIPSESIIFYSIFSQALMFLLIVVYNSFQDLLVHIN